jgi:hypothetical protein
MWPKIFRWDWSYVKFDSYHGPGRIYLRRFKLFGTTEVNYEEYINNVNKLQPFDRPTELEGDDYQEALRLFK